MREVAFDTETFAIRGGIKAPLLVCAAFYALDMTQAQLVGRNEAVSMARAMLSDPRAVVVGQNLPFDAAVTCAVDPDLVRPWFEAYRDGRTRDTRTRERLISNALGNLELDSKKRRFSLEALAAKYLHLDLKAEKQGADAWRLRYHELEGVPIEDYPPEAAEYAKGDAVHTLQVYKAQMQAAADAGVLEADGSVTNEAAMNRAAFVLHLAAVYGLRTDRDAVAALRADHEERITGVRELLEAEGIARPNGTVDQRALRACIAKAYGIDPDVSIPENLQTAKGQLKTDAMTLIASGDPLLVKYGVSKRPEWHLRNTIKELEAGVDRPICCNYTVPQASGRSSSSRPNVQNYAKKGGYRECFRPRPGSAYVIADYSQLELCTLAQIWRRWFGSSSLGDAIAAGRDLHLMLVAEFVGARYEDVSKETHGSVRDLCKAANYGFPVGMGAQKFLTQVRKQVAQGYLDESLASTTIDQCEELRAAWRRLWCEAPEYFERIADLSEGGGRVVQPISGRVRGGCNFTQAGNSFFQGLAADGALESLWRVSWECYCEPESPLWLSRPVAFIHDEIVLESPLDRAHDVAMRLSELMVEGMRAYVPDVPIEAEPLVSTLWTKEARPVWVDGRLVPWVPECHND